jgi:hypothetical protein
MQYHEINTGLLCKMRFLDSINPKVLLTVSNLCRSTLGFMLSPTTKIKHARLTTLLVLLIMILCLFQRAGFNTSCTSNFQGVEKQSVTQNDNKQIMSSINLQQDKCDSTEHLLQAHNNAIDFVILFIALILGGLFFYPTLSSKLSSLRLSRGPPRPLFLIFCTFRE